MLKVALIHSHLNDRGGSQRYVIEIANNLIELGIHVDIYCYEYNKKSCYPELTKGLNIEKIYTREMVEKKTKQIIKQNLKKIYKNSFVKNIVNILGIDYLCSIYLTNNYAKQVSNLILEINKEYDLIFAHEEPLSVYAAIEYKKNKKIPIYWFCYDTIEKWFLEWKDEHKKSFLRGLLLKKIYFKYDKFLINRYVNKTSVLDHNMLNRYTKLYDMIPDIRRGGIPEFILSYKKKNLIRKKINLSDDNIIIFSLTRFVNYRRVHDLLDMYEKLSNDIKKRVFIFINSPITDSTYYEWCMRKHEKTLQNDNIKISLDYPKNDIEMYDLYLSSDIFIYPNENQTWGHAPLEAMGCGVATFVSTGCGIHEEIKKVTPDTIFKTKNIDELVNKIEKIILNKTYKQVGNRQKDYVKKNLTWNKICKIYKKDFENILKAKV